MEPLRIVSVGLGPIGLEAARRVLRAATLELVAAVDVDPAKQGRPVGELLGLPEASGPEVQTELAAALERSRPEVALLCTSSRLPDVRRDLLAAVSAGVDVVSTCEELVYPAARHPELAREIDAAAVAGDATVVGTGVNPGFVLDFLPVVLAAATSEVRRVRAVRVLDAAARRRPLQQKVGAGLEREQFEARLRRGELGHVGMLESVHLIGAALGFAFDETTETTEPVIAERPLEGAGLTVAPGRVAGIHSVARGLFGGEALVELDLTMALGAPDPRDEIVIEGERELRFRVEGGLPGDAATAALAVNTARQAAAAPAGLKTVLDLPPPRPVR